VRSANPCLRWPADDTQVSPHHRADRIGGAVVDGRGGTAHSLRAGTRPTSPATGPSAEPGASARRHTRVVGDIAPTAGAAISRSVSERLGRHIAAVHERDVFRHLAADVPDPAQNGDVFRHLAADDPPGPQSRTSIEAVASSAVTDLPGRGELTGPGRRPRPTQWRHEMVGSRLSAAKYRGCRRRTG
jgi:hypothetical protein